MPARPDVRFRVVGRGSERLSWAADEPGVDLVGRVEDLQEELDRTDVSVVPIRVGAGTRLKVVEALSNHLPMVTTTVGCEGIPVVDGRSALVADDAPGFAAACVRLLDDGDLRQLLADEGAALFRASYTWASIRERVAGPGPTDRRQVSRHHRGGRGGGQSRTTAGEWRKNCSTSRS